MPHKCVHGQGSIDSGNGLSPVRRQAITWTNADLPSIGPSETIVNEIWIRNSNISIHENAFEHVVCKLVTILSRGR